MTVERKVHYVIDDLFYRSENDYGEVLRENSYRGLIEMEPSMRQVVDESGLVGEMVNDIRITITSHEPYNYNPVIIRLWASDIEQLNDIIKERYKIVP